ILHGENFDEAEQEALRRRDAEGKIFLHPFDDEGVIAGQGTIGLELLEQAPDIEAVVVAVGGGGLIAGVACALKESRPNVRVVGVETLAIPSMEKALIEHRPVLVPVAPTIAEGIAVRQAGELPFETVQRYVDEMVMVDDEEIAIAILRLLEKQKTL